MVTDDLLASLFDVERILVSYATVTDVAEINDARRRTLRRPTPSCNSKSALLCYTPSSPSPDDAGRAATPSPGTATSAATPTGIRMKNFRMEQIASDRIEGEMTYDMKVVAPDMGIFMANAVA